MGQQRETASFGMWLFLLTEIMFFGGLFMAYLLYRNWYYDAFVASSNTLGIGLGTTNTAVLILSSFTMAMGVYSAEIRSRKGPADFSRPDHMFGLGLSRHQERGVPRESTSSIIFPGPASAWKTLSIPLTSAMFPWRPIWRSTPSFSSSCTSP